MAQTATHHSEPEPAPSVDLLRIGYVADDLYPGFGGQAKATEGHIETLLGRGHAVRVLAGHEAEPTQAPRGVELRRLPSWQPGETQTGFAWPSPGAIRWLVDWADVVHVNTPTPLALAVGLAARTRGIPCVMGVHTQLESSSLHFDRGRAMVESSVAAWFRTLYSTPDALTAPTPFAARTAQRFTRKPIHVVSNGVRVPSEPFDRGVARGMLPADLRPHEGERVLLYVGRLAPEKRPGDLLDLVEHADDGVTLWIAGHGPLAGDLQRDALRRGLTPGATAGAVSGIAPGPSRGMSRSDRPRRERVRFLGFVSEAEKRLLLAAADLFVMPSPTELQSIAMLEAMAHGRAVAAADHPSSAVPEAVREARAGLVYPPDDASTAAAAIGELLRDRARLGACERAARAWVEQHSVVRSAATLEALYLDLVA